jgi:hypothetical protein
LAADPLIVAVIVAAPSRYGAPPGQRANTRSFPASFRCIGFLCMEDVVAGQPCTALAADQDMGYTNIDETGDGGRHVFGDSGSAGIH